MLIFLPILTSLGVSARAESPACPTVPSGFTETIAAAMRAAADRILGVNGPTSPSPFSELDEEQKKEVLDQLAEELAGREEALEELREEEETENKASEFRRRIGQLDRDWDNRRLEGRRINASPKPLSKILEEEAEKAAPKPDQSASSELASTGSQFAESYAEAMRKAIMKDPKAFSEMAGSLAGGDYAKAMDTGMDTFADGFSSFVGDELERRGLDNASSLWKAAAENAGTAKEVMQALARGERDVAWDKLTEGATEGLKDKSKDIVKGVINWAASPSGASYTDFKAPALLSDKAKAALAPDFFKKTPGDIYIDLLEAEMQAIEWSKDYIQRKSEFGDGACIRKYGELYNSLGQSEAFDRFHECLVTSKLSGFHQFTNDAESMGLDPNAAMQEFLEAHRKGETTALTPGEWIAERLTKHREELEKTLKPELTGLETVMKNLSEAAGRAMNNRLTDLAAAKLNEIQWNRLEEKLRELERVRDQTMAAVQSDLDRIRKNSDAVAEACKAFDEQKTLARQALGEGSNLSVEASRLLDRLNGIDTSQCRQDEGVQTSEAEAARRDARVAIDSALADLDAKIAETCAAPGKIRGSATKDEARGHLDAGLAAARESQTQAASVKTMADKLASLGPSDPATAAAARAAERQKLTAEIATLKSEIEGLAGRFGALQGRFDPAYQSMARARDKISGLVYANDEPIERVRACLAPLRDVPVADSARTAYEELSRRAGDDTGCMHVVNESWNTRDPDPATSDGLPSSSAWRYRKPLLMPSLEQLRGKLAALEAACPATAPAAEATVAPPHMPTAEEAHARADAALSKVNTCVSDAVTGYSDLIKKQRQDDAAEIAAADSAIARCDVDAMDAAMVRLARLNSEAARAKAQELAVASARCAKAEREREEQEAAEARSAKDGANREAVCRRDFGEGYVVGQVLPDGRFFCTPTQSTADAWCRSKNGAGYRAASIDERGGFNCLMDKAAADAWCSEHNSGSGWSAGEMQPDGSYACLQSESGQRAAAEADCERQHGKRLIRVYRSKGQYWCEYSQPGKQARRPKPRRGGEPGYDPEAAAAAAAAAAAIAETIQTYQRNKAAKRKCHRNPYTGQIHCGSN
jgi:hypothetical protein